MKSSPGVVILATKEPEKEGPPAIDRTDPNIGPTVSGPIQVEIIVIRHPSKYTHIMKYSRLHTQQFTLSRL
jgi:hypothetical protein